MSKADPSTSEVVKTSQRPIGMPKYDPDGLDLSNKAGHCSNILRDADDILSAYERTMENALKHHFLAGNLKNQILDMEDEIRHHNSELEKIVEMQKQMVSEVEKKLVEAVKIIKLPSK